LKQGRDQGLVVSPTQTNQEISRMRPFILCRMVDEDSLIKFKLVVSCRLELALPMMCLAL
jgi:hypothetical protein